MAGVRVFARFREVEREREGGLVTEFPDERTVEATFVRRPEQNFSFTFDRVFPPRVSAAEIHSQCAEPAAKHLAAGNHAIIYAYGHGGSGKTVTIFGQRDGKEKGLLRAAESDRQPRQSSQSRCRGRRRRHRFSNATAPR